MMTRFAMLTTAAVSLVFGGLAAPASALVLTPPPPITPPITASDWNAVGQWSAPLAIPAGVELVHKHRTSHQQQGCDTAPVRLAGVQLVGRRWGSYEQQACNPASVPSAGVQLVGRRWASYEQQACDTVPMPPAGVQLVGRRIASQDGCAETDPIVRVSRKIP